MRSKKAETITPSAVSLLDQICGLSNPELCLNRDTLPDPEGTLLAESETPGSSIPGSRRWVRSSEGARDGPAQRPGPPPPLPAPAGRFGFPEWQSAEDRRDPRPLPWAPTQQKGPLPPAPGRQREPQLPPPRSGRGDPSSRRPPPVPGRQDARGSVSAGCGGGGRGRSPRSAALRTASEGGHRREGTGGGQRAPGSGLRVPGLRGSEAPEFGQQRPLAGDPGLPLLAPPLPPPPPRPVRSAPSGPAGSPSPPAPQPGLRTPAPSGRDREKV
ncbi:proline-rich protein HaeIII subfamily 1-like [Tachyglossus aculeatus]|uniref:proline-rich protein HaeIII subfamily 1-like n=1 Tax=Tachyglossus aculeatus TaxID=9261 RepID=UPI0018F5CFB2|nr:proline-rich protein HaeIII subfamily 1-like [Tachyglossus aculeatus]